MKTLQDIRYVIARLLNRRPCAVKHSEIHPTASVGNGTQFVHSKIGRYSYVHSSSIAKTEIGSFCSIAKNTGICVDLECE